MAWPDALAAPRRRLLVAVGLAFLFSLVGLARVASTPSLGVKLAPVSEPPAVRVEQVASTSPNLDRLRPGTLKLNCAVEELNAGKRQARLSNGETVDGELILTSLPLPKLAALTSDLPEDLARAAKQLSHVSIRAVNLGVSGDPTHGDAQWVYCPEPELAFHRIGLPTALTPTINTLIGAEEFSAAAMIWRYTYTAERVPTFAVRKQALLKALRANAPTHASSRPTSRPPSAYTCAPPSLTT